MSSRGKKGLWVINNFGYCRMLCICFDQITLKKKRGFNAFKFETLQQIRNIFLLLFFDKQVLFKQRSLCHKITVILLISQDPSCDGYTRVSVYFLVRVHCSLLNDFICLFLELMSKGQHYNFAKSTKRSKLSGGADQTMYFNFLNYNFLLVLLVL